MASDMTSEATDGKALKRCPQCRESKRISAFTKCRTTRDGLQPHCRACQNARQRLRVTALKVLPTLLTIAKGFRDGIFVARVDEKGLLESLPAMQALAMAMSRLQEEEEE